MDYETTLGEIGQFGKWQKMVFVLASICAVFEAFLTLNPSFTTYDPPFRCDVPACRNASQLTFEDVVSFTTPNRADGDPDGCRVFDFIGTQTDGSQCQESFFDKTKVVDCQYDQYAYDHSQFKLTATEAFNIPPCGTDWPLYVSTTDFLIFEPYRKYRWTCKGRS